MRHGFLLIDKPSGPTSHDAVAIVRRTLSESHVGHLGTLDPLASGLLVLAVGSKALKVIEFFSDLPKEYEALVRFGAVSSTYDAQGMIEASPAKPGWEPPDQSVLLRMLRERFTGKIKQVPPAHSAVHVDGKRAYERARRGESVDLPARTVDITACDVLAYEYPTLKLRIRCGAGTYIRSLAHDLGVVLRCGGYLEGLRRTKVGEWVVGDAAAPERAAWSHVLPLKEILKTFHGIELTDAEAIDIGFGRAVRREVQPDTIAWHKDLPVAVLMPAKDGSRMAQPRKVL